MAACLLVGGVVQSCGKHGEAGLWDGSSVKKMEDADFLITVKGASKTLCYEGSFENSSWYRCTTSSPEGTMSFEMNYWDDAPMSFEQVSDNELRYIYRSWSEDYYSVRLKNVELSSSAMTFDLVIAGKWVADVEVAVEDGMLASTDLSKILKATGGPVKWLREAISRLIPPIDISLSSDNTLNIKINNTNGDGGGNSSTSGINDNGDIAAQCLAAGVKSAKLCMEAGYGPLTIHNGNHTSFIFDCR